MKIKSLRSASALGLQLLCYLVLPSVSRGQDAAGVASDPPLIRLEQWAEELASERIGEGEFRAFVSPWMIWNDSGQRRLRVDRQPLTGWAQAAPGFSGSGFVLMLCDPTQGVATFELRGDLTPGSVVGPDPDTRMGGLVGGFNARRFSRGLVRIDEAPADPTVTGGIWAGTVKVSFDGSLANASNVEPADFVAIFRAPIVERARMTGWVCPVARQ